MNTNQQPTSWPKHAMEYWLSGYLEGISAGRRLTELEMAASWAHVAHIVHANARLEPWTAHEQAIKARRAARLLERAEPVPWPDEVTP